jgi:hypothetical protein
MDDEDKATPKGVTESADMESLSLSLNPDFMEIIERSRQRQDEEGGISSEEMRRRFGAMG